MIYIMTTNHFRSMDEILCAPKDYIIINAVDIAIMDTESGSNRIDLGTHYNNVVSIPSLCADTFIYNALVKQSYGEPINKREFDKRVDAFLSGPEFINGVLSILKALIFTTTNRKIQLMDTSKNVFLILPELIYRYLGSAISREITNLCRTRIDVVLYGRTHSERDIYRSNTELVIPHKKVKDNVINASKSGTQSMLYYNLTAQSIKSVESRITDIDTMLKKLSGDYIDTNDRDYRSKYLG